MVIYADILFITNLYIDFFLLVCVKNFLHLEQSTGRLLLGALAGAACSMTALLPELPAFVSVLLGIAAALLVAAAAFAPVKWPGFCKLSVCYWFFSFLFAGFFLLVYNFLAPANLAVISGVVYLNISPVMLFGLTLAAYLILSLLQKILGPKESDLRFCKLRIENGGQAVILFAKADTGNSLSEPFSGLPVIIAEWEALEPLLPGPVRQFLEHGTADGSLRLIPFEAMGGNGILPAFRPEKVRFEKGTENLPCYLAVCPQKLSAGQYSAIFNPDRFVQESRPASKRQKRGAAGANGSPLR